MARQALFAGLVSDPYGHPVEVTVIGEESFYVVEGTMKAIGQDDIFTKAVIERSLENMEDQFDRLIESGLPEDVLTWMGMQGFAVHIDERGQVTRIDQPGTEL